jgi:hypothetical protein
MKRFIPPAVSTLLVLALAGCPKQQERPAAGGEFTSQAQVTAQTEACLQCHTLRQPLVVETWQRSGHAAAGVGCSECHRAGAGEPDAMDHFGNTVAVLVTPADCGRCHAAQAEQFAGSLHARGGQVLASLDNYLGEVVEGFGASVSGCRQCHGSPVIVNAGGVLSPETWPNFGIGRINPDGSLGACTACHSRHEFTRAQVRSPEACGRCHLGPDHPQKEVYEESKHSIVYSAYLDRVNLASESWVLGVDNTAAPNCASCHVSATPNQPATHSIGLRISWNLRTPESVRTEDWERKRQAMQEVCLTCHSSSYVTNFYLQFDAGIELYNEKFARPAGEIMARLREAGRIDPTPFNEPIEWMYYYLWHHDGRRARNGLAMQGPDYVQWHGFYDVAERFYIELVPEAERLLAGVARDIMDRPEHRWARGAMTEAERQEIREFYRRRYSADVQ